MISKHVLSRISPIDQMEKYYVESLHKVKMENFDERGLAYSLMKEDMLLSEAFALANSISSWISELDSNYSKFKNRSTCILTCEEAAFLLYCQKKNWSTKKTANSIVARDHSKFKSKFELDTGKVYMTEPDSSLEYIKILNEFEVT